MRTFVDGFCRLAISIALLATVTGCGQKSSTDVRSYPATTENEQGDSDQINNEGALNSHEAGDVHLVGRPPLPDDCSVERDSCLARAEAEYQFCLGQGKDQNDVIDMGHAMICHNSYEKKGRSCDAQAEICVKQKAFDMRNQLTQEEQELYDRYQQEAEERRRLEEAKRMFQEGWRPAPPPEYTENPLWPNDEQEREEESPTSYADPYGSDDYLERAEESPASYPDPYGSNDYQF